MRKILALAALIMVVLAGCGNTNDQVANCGPRGVHSMTDRADFIYIACNNGRVYQVYND